MENKHNMLMNLLAVIHRDGGHYVSEHGFEKATEDAMNVIIEERNRLAQSEDSADWYCKDCEQTWENIDIGYQYCPYCGNHR